MAAKRRTTARGANRLRKALRELGMTEDELSASAELIQNVGWLEDRLFNARIDVGDAPLVETYDHGGGQSGTKKAAWVEAYSKLYASYVSGLRSLLDRLDTEHKVSDAAHSDVKSKIQALREAERNRNGDD